MMIKLNGEQALELYKLTWRGESDAQLAEKYHVTKAQISAIKHGHTWRSVTLHQRDHMSIEQKKAILLKNQEVAITTDDRFLALLEERGQDIADQFKQAIYGTRGRLKRKLTIDEVEEIYNLFTKNGLRINE